MKKPIKIWKVTLPLWGWILLGLVILGAFTGGTSQEEVKAQEARDAAAAAQYRAQREARAKEDAARKQARLRIASDILALGETPQKQSASETSTEGNRRYFTWARPDLGEQVNTVWIAPDDWWVKISGVNFNHRDLGAIENGRFTEGPLAGLVMNSRVPDKVLHIETDKWAARNGHLP